MWLQVSQVENEVDAVYHNSLSVPGRFTGQYQCTIMNNQMGSATSAVLFVRGMFILHVCMAEGMSHYPLSNQVPLCVKFHIMS